MTKKVNKGQRLNGNVSATALNYLNKLIGQDKQSLLSKPGGPIKSGEGAGVFVDAKYEGHLAALNRGDWAYIRAPLYTSVGREGQFPFDQAWHAVTSLSHSPEHGLGTQTVPVLAMATEPIKKEKVGRFQISGLAHCLVNIPELPNEPPFSLSSISNYYPDALRTARLKDQAKTPTASTSDVGPIEIVWHEPISNFGRNGDGPYQAVVRWPAIPRGPRASQYNASATVTTSTGGLMMNIASLNYNVGGSPTHCGTTLQTNPGDDLIFFLRPGAWRITATVTLSAPGGSPALGDSVHLRLKIGDSNAPLHANRDIHAMYPGRSFSITLFERFNYLDWLNVEVVDSDLGCTVNCLLSLDGPYNNYHDQNDLDT